MIFKNNRAPLLCYFKLCASFCGHWSIQTGVTVRKRPIWVKFNNFWAMWPWNFQMTLNSNEAPFLCYFKLCASFRSHWWIQTGVTVRKRPIWVKFDDFWRGGTLKFDWWPCKTTGHLFYAISSFVHDFVPIGEFKLGLQSKNAQFGSISMIFLGVWPSNLMDDIEKQ